LNVFNNAGQCDKNCPKFPIIELYRGKNTPNLLGNLQRGCKEEVKLSRHCHYQVEVGIEPHQKGDDGDGNDADDVLVVGDRLLELVEAAFHAVRVQRVRWILAADFTLLFSQTWGRCYDIYFRQFSPIFDEKMAFFSKTNVMSKFCKKLAVV
jgi:hypothetical protein